jgi:teichuronic acid exporter
MTQQNLKELTVRGIQWNLVEQASVYLITMCATIVLSRLLFPEVYGLFGMLTVLTNLAVMIVNMGLGYAIIQNNTLDHRDHSTIFWFNIALGCLIALVFYVAAPGISAFYHQPDLTNITRYFSLVFIIQGLNAVPQNLLIKNLLFKRFAASQITASVISNVSAIVLAVNGFGVWSLVAQALIQQVTAFVCNAYLSGWTPLWVFQIETLKKIRRFSGNLLSSQLIDFAATNLDLLLTGKYLGKRDLGLLGRSQALVMLPVTSFGYILNRTLFPMFSSLQKNSDDLQIRYAQGMKALCLLILPMVILIGIFSSEITLILFGNQWSSIAPLVSILAVYACLTCINSFNDSFLVTQGRTDLLMRLNIVEKCTLIISIIVALRFGLLGIVVAKVATIGLMFAPRVFIVCRVLKIKLSSWCRAQSQILVGIAITTLSALVLKSFFADLHYIARVSASSIISLMIYYSYLRIIKEPTTHDVTAIFKDHFKRLFPAMPS